MRVAGGVCCLLFTAASAVVGQTLEDAARLAARGDTAGAIAAYEALIAQNERNAEAHFRAGLLRLARAQDDGPVSEDRRKGEAHLRYAARFAPDSARYWMALADYFRSQTLVTLRVQVPRVVGNAQEAADRAGNPVEIADAACRGAWVELDRWGQYGRRYRATNVQERVVVPPVNAEWKDWDTFATRLIRPAARDMGFGYLAAAEQKLRHGLETRPADGRLLGLLVVVLGEQDRWAQAVALMRHATTLAPDSGRAWALYGLALARVNRWHEAQGAFRTGLARMTPEERAPYREIGQIMRRADRLRWEGTPYAAREAFDSLYWRAAQPLVLTETNELQAEFYARLTYADHRWTDPWRGYRGALTDMGAVYVAYGPPDFWAVMMDDAAAQSIAWLYRVPQFRFVFTQMSGYAHAYFADESKEALRVDRILSPARFDNVPVYRMMDTIPVQAAQFRGPGDSTAIAVFGAVPLRRMTAALPLATVPLVSGALLQNRRGVELLRDRRSETVRITDETPAVQHRSWRLTIGPGEYVLRVEAHVPAHDRAARGVRPFAVRSFWGSWLMLSDLLVAGRVAPRDSTAARWSDYLIEPNGGWFTPGQSVGLLWEIYNLAPDAAGQVAYTVDLRFTIESITRRNIFAQIAGGIADAVGLTAKGDDRIALHYTHTADATPSRVHVEYLTVDLKDSPEGVYTIEVEVTDLRTGGSVVRRQVIHIDRAPPVRCDPCPDQVP
jgi:GWxTD domain-containing protein